jgi:hypothetical protein
LSEQRLILKSAGLLKWGYVMTDYIDIEDRLENVLEARERRRREALENSEHCKPLDFENNVYGDNEEESE